MNTDIRVDIGFFNHRKTRKLIKKFGLEAAWGLLQLWAFAAKSKSDGCLKNMSNEDIAMECHLEEKVDPDEFVEYIKSDECRWIDTTEDGLYLHDWHVHNPWAAGSDDRSDISRLARMAKTHPLIYKKLREEGVTAITRKAYQELTKPQRTVNEPLTNGQGMVKPALSPAPSPAPSPDPSPDPLKDITVRKKKSAPDPRVKEVIDYFYAQCKSVLGFAPAINGGQDGKRIQDALRVMPSDDVKKCIDAFLPSKKCSELGCTLSIALSTHSINLYKQGGKNGTRFDQLRSFFGFSEQPGAGGVYSGGNSAFGGVDRSKAGNRPAKPEESIIPIEYLDGEAEEIPEMEG